MVTPAARGREEAREVTRKYLMLSPDVELERITAAVRLMALVESALSTRDREVERLRAMYDEEDPDSWPPKIHGSAQQAYVVGLLAERDTLRRQYEHACDALGAIGRQLTAAGHTPAGSESDHSDYLTAVQTLMVERDTLQAQVEELKAKKGIVMMPSIKRPPLELPCGYCGEFEQHDAECPTMTIADLRAQVEKGNEDFEHIRVSNAALTTEVLDLRTELDAIDHLLARRAALDDLPDRLTKIQHAIGTAKKADELRVQLDAAKVTQERLVREKIALCEDRDEVRRALLVLQAGTDAKTLKSYMDRAIKAEAQLDAVTRQFHCETLRTSASARLLRQFADVFHADGHFKGRALCARCALVQETEELLLAPVNVPKVEADLLALQVELGRVTEALEIGLRYAKGDMPDAPGHSCGPESACDSECAAFAYQSQAVAKIESALRTLGLGPKD